MAEWKAFRLWEYDTTCFILGGGKSLLDEDLTLLHDKHKKRVIGVNDAFRLGRWVDVCYFGDSRWFDWNRQDLCKFTGLKICCCPKLSHSKNYINWVHTLKRGKSLGIETRPDFISWSKSSGASAINLAVHLGAKKIVLLGFDMRLGNKGEHNWHDYHKVKNDLNALPYSRFLQAFPVIAEDAKCMGVEIINSTMCSTIEDFPKIPLQEVIKSIH